MIGFLVLGPKRSGAVFTADDLRTFDALAHQAAIAVENARFHREGVTLGKLEAAHELLAAMGHEMGNVLHIGVIALGALKLNLQENPDKPLPSREELTGHLARVERALLRGRDVLGDASKYLTASDLEGIRAIPLAQFIQDAVEVMKKRFEDHPNIRVEVDIKEHLPVVEGLATLPLLPLHLLAIPFWGLSVHSGGGTIRVSAMVDADRSHIKLIVSDDASVPLRGYLERAERIGDEVFPTRSRHGAFYYFVVKKIVSDHHGRLVVEDGFVDRKQDGLKEGKGDIQQGTTMVVELPLKYESKKPERIWKSDIRFDPKALYGL